MSCSVVCVALGSCALVFSLSAQAAAPPVILISVDTLRADHLGIYGDRRVHTPNIDALALGGTVYREVSSQIPLTLPSHDSLFTSTYPFANRVEENAGRIPENSVTLASILHDRGYATAAFIGSIYLEREMGLDRGFDFYDSPFRFEAFSSISGSMFYGDRNSNPLQARSRRDGALVIRAALQWLRAHRDKPEFAFVHLFDLHQPYRLASYDAEIEYADRLIGAFHDALARDGLWDHALIVFLSDHGESLGDHGEQTHGYFIYQSTLHVPLIVHWPAGSPARAAEVRQPAGLIDVAPTVLDFLHIARPASFAGHSLLDPHREPVYSESVYSRDAFGWSALRSLRAGNYKYIAAPHAELYDLAADPNERVNVISRHPAEARALTDQLQRLLHAFPAGQGSAAGVSPEKMAALKSLGYLAPGARSNEISGADPKDRLPEYQLYERAQDDMLSGRTAAAITILRRILAQDAGNTLARRDLGIAYNSQQKYAPARANLEKAAIAAPSDFVVQFELGVADEHLGSLDAALEHLRAACRLAPQSEGCARELKAAEQKAHEQH